MELQHEPSTAIKVGRHVVGMALFALLNPLIYYDPSPVFVWATGWAAGLVLAAILFGFYALFFTKKAASHWPTGFFVLAWVIVLLYTIGGWGEYNQDKKASESEFWKKGGTLVN